MGYYVGKIEMFDEEAIYNRRYEEWLRGGAGCLAGSMEQDSLKMLEPSTGADASSNLDPMLITNEQDFGIEQ